MSFEIPTITTERLVLRAPALQDFDALCAYYQDPRSRFNGGPRDAREVGRTLMASLGQWHFLGHGIWHVTFADDGTFIGFAGIFHPLDWPEPELGYGIIAEYEGRGIAFEAAMAARRGAAEHCGLTHLPSFIAADNTRSQALAQRMGATFEKEITLRGDTDRVYRHPKQETA